MKAIPASTMCRTAFFSSREILVHSDDSIFNSFTKVREAKCIELVMIMYSSTG